MTPDRACIDRHCGVFKLLVHGWQRRGSAKSDRKGPSQHDCAARGMRPGFSFGVRRLHPLPVQHLRAHAPATVPTNSP